MKRRLSSVFLTTLTDIQVTFPQCQYCEHSTYSRTPRKITLQENRRHKDFLVFELLYSAWTHKGASRLNCELVQRAQRIHHAWLLHRLNHNTS